MEVLKYFVPLCKLNRCETRDKLNEQIPICCSAVVHGGFEVTVRKEYGGSGAKVRILLQSVQDGTEGFFTLFWDSFIFPKKHKKGSGGLAEKIKIKEAIVVEGKYDKIKLSSIFDTLIIETTGFSIRGDKEKQRLIRKCAAETGIIVFTDSDRAGFLIRNFLNGSVPSENIKHAYIPQIEGKESRKETPSKDGFLGVEGVDREIIIKAVLSAAPKIVEKNGKKVTKADFYAMGLSGRENSEEKRNALKKKLGLPKNLSATALMQTVNQLMTYEEFENLLKSI